VEEDKVATICWRSTGIYLHYQVSVRLLDRVTYGDIAKTRRGTPIRGGQGDDGCNREQNEGNISQATSI